MAQRNQQHRTLVEAWLSLAPVLVVALALANLAIVTWLCLDHLTFPLNLDLMENTVLQHVQRAAAGQAIYPEPSPQYVPLAYNPLFYLLCVPFSWVFGLETSTLRLVGVCGYLVSGIVLYQVVRRRAASAWWALIAAGLFAAAYSALDLYMDTAHSDSWLIASVLLGSLAIDQGRSRRWTAVGIVLLVSSFWFKQHGALFVLGGLAFVTWRDGVRMSLPFWILAAVLGAGGYLVAGPYLFGSHFHYFTWTVPSQWSEISLRTFRRYIGYNLIHYPVLSLAALFLLYRAIGATRQHLDVWRVQLAASLAAGFMGSLDPGSSYNVYIPLGTFFILLGTLGLYEMAEMSFVRQYGLHLAALLLSFVALAYDPTHVAVSGRAADSYADLIRMLGDLNGTVYAPSLGQLAKDYTLQPAAHWVPLEDMLRGPGRDTRNQPLTRRLLEPAIHPAGAAFILANERLDAEAWPQHLAFLLDYYVLDTDLGDRFEPLRCLPKRYDHGWPRYLYRYAPGEVGAHSSATGR